MATQYTLDLALAATAGDSALQAVISYLNPSIGALSHVALQEFQQQLEAVTSNGKGVIHLTNVAVDPSSTSTNPLFDLAYTGAPHEALQAGGGFDTLTGAAGDTLYGSSSATGAAKLYAGGGREVLYGGAGHDTLYAGSGHDTLYGGSGAETLYGSTAHGGHALLEAGSGDQALYAGDGHDTLVGGSGNDTLYGGDGASTLIAGSGHDTMYGGNGPTTFEVSKATFNDDLIIGGSGHDVLKLTDLNRSDVTIKSSHGVTTVEFGSHELTLKGVDQIQFGSQDHGSKDEDHLSFHHGHHETLH
jgi:Ca2+-binding RTX toxin-like protein